MIARAAHFSTRVVAWLVAVAALLVATTAARAGEWLLVPSATLTTGTDTNPRLLPDPPQDEYGTQADVAATLSGGTERLDLAISPRVSLLRSRSDRSLDSENYYLTVASQWRSERSTWSAGVDWVRDNTRLSELGGSGLVQGDSRREGLSLSAGPTWQVSERVTAGARVGWDDTRYLDAGNSGLADYTRTTASLFGSAALSARTSFTLSAQGGVLDSPARSEPTRNVGLTAGVRHEFSPRWQAELAAGPAWATSGTDTVSGYLFSAEIARRGELAQLSAVATRRLDPLGTGLLAVVEELSLGVTRPFSERLTVSVAARATRNRTLFDSADLPDQETRYLGLDASLRWQVTEAWSVVLDVGQRQQEVLPFQPDRADSYRATLGVSWNGRGMIL